MAGDARLSEAAGKDCSFLGHGVDVESSRHGVAVLESDGFHARGTAGHFHAATGIQVPVPGRALLVTSSSEFWRQPLARSHVRRSFRTSLHCSTITSYAF